MSNPENFKVRDYWQKQSCGEVYSEQGTEIANYLAQANVRYELEPFIKPFANFEHGKGKDVLEIGVGMGADHEEWAKSQPRSLSGIDLTERAIVHTSRRLSLLGLTSNLQVADAERLPFADSTFDIVYSWGVLHHSANTRFALGEVQRVLKKGGTALIMVYNKYSIVGVSLWVRYALLRGRPLTSLKTIYAQYLESPNTKAFTSAEVNEMLNTYENCEITIELSAGDLMTGAAGQRHGGLLLNFARFIWPRKLISKTLRKNGLFLTVRARK